MMSIATKRGVAVLFAFTAFALALAGCSQAKPPATPAATSPPATPAASSYSRDANATLEALASSSSGVADVMAKADPASASWRATLNTRLDALTQVDARARALKPSAAETEAHQRLIEVTADYSRAAQLIRSSVDPLNVENLDQAAQILTSGVTKIAALRTILPPA